MSVLNVERADFMRGENILIFERSVERFLDERAPPPGTQKWRSDGAVDRASSIAKARRGK